MRLVRGKRIGQSGFELRRAVLLSCIIHALAIIATLILFKASPRFHVPPVYRVDLVELAEPTEIAAEQPPAPPSPPAAPRPEPPTPKPKPKPKPPAMPELKEREPAPVVRDTPPAEAPALRQAVAIAAPQEFRFPPYVALVRDKIERNWNPPPGTAEIKAKVVFTLHRSGRVIAADLVQSSGNFYFDQAAMRAVLASSPFPPFPEGLFTEREVFSVDMMERQ